MLALSAVQVSSHSFQLSDHSVIGLDHNHADYGAVGGLINETITASRPVVGSTAINSEPNIRSLVTQTNSSL